MFGKKNLMIFLTGTNWFKRILNQFILYTIGLGFPIQDKPLIKEIWFELVKYIFD